MSRERNLGGKGETPNDTSPRPIPIEIYNCGADVYGEHPGATTDDVDPNDNIFRCPVTGRWVGIYPRGSEFLCDYVNCDYQKLNPPHGI